MKVYFSDPLTFASTITRLPSDVTGFSMFAAQRFLQPHSQVLSDPTWKEKEREPGNEVGILGQKQPLVFMFPSFFGSSDSMNFDKFCDKAPLSSVTFPQVRRGKRLCYQTRGLWFMKR